MNTVVGVSVHTYNFEFVAIIHESPYSLHELSMVNMGSKVFSPRTNSTINFSDARGSITLSCNEL